MNSNTELALLAGVSYQASRDRINRFPIPEGWSAFSIINWPYGSTRYPQDNIPNRAYWQDGASGFEAAAFGSCRVFCGRSHKFPHQTRDNSNRYEPFAKNPPSLSF